MYMLIWENAFFWQNAGMAVLVIFLFILRSTCIQLYEGSYMHALKYTHTQSQAHLIEIIPLLKLKDFMTFDEPADYASESSL